MLNKKLKILLINTFFTPFGGAEIVAYNTYKILRNHNHDVFFFSSDKEPLFEQNENVFTTKFIGGTKNYLKNPVRYYYNKKAKKDLQKCIEKVKPDLIHIHSRFGFSNSITDCIKNFPTIMTIHDTSLFCPACTLMKHNNEYCNNLPCKKLKFYNCILNNCDPQGVEGGIRHTIRCYLDLKLLKNIDNFILPTETLKELIIKAQLGIDKQKLNVINNFLIKEQLNIEPNYTDNDYFLYVGRLSSEKGLLYLLKAMKELPSKISLHIVGSGPDEKNLKNFVLENNLNNIHFLGFLSGEKLTKEYQNCIATILPCNWFEVFGLTNIESFIHGKPVIASNIGSIPEIVTNNECGLLFEPGNIEMIKVQILKYWNNRNIVIEHGKNAYNKIFKFYCEDIYYEKLIKLYKETINEYIK